MAGLTLLAIISFIFLPAILDLVGGGRGGPGSQILTIAESRQFGRVTEAELYRFQENHDALRRFLEVLYRQLLDDEADADNRFERMQTLRPLESYIVRLAQLRSPEQLVNVWLVTQHAQHEGLTPDWNDVSHLLSQLSGNLLSDEIYRDALRLSGLSHQALEQLLIRQIRWEKSFERFSLSTTAISPVTHWDWFQRLNRQVAVEAAAVPVAQFVNQVGEPTDRQLNAFFDAHKTQRHNPLSSEVGFIVPVELAFQYIIAEPTQMLLDSITDEEILAYYEENKDIEFRRPVSPLLESPRFPGSGGIFPTLPGAGTGTAPFPTPGNVITPTVEPPTVGPGQEDEPTETEPSETEPGETEPGLDGNAMTERNVTTRLVSYQNDDEITESESANEESASESADVPVDLSVLYRPFDEVKEQIRETLAERKAIDALSLVQEKMTEYSGIYLEHYYQGRQPPPMPDLSAFAAELGLELVTVPMGNIYAAMQTGLARGLQERQHLVRMFHSEPLLFQIETFVGDQNVVLLWVTGHNPELKPERLAEVRDFAVQRWKEVEARKLALQKAQELANEAKTSDQSLVEAFADRSDLPVVATEPFTWKSYGSLSPFAAVLQRIPPMLGEVRELGVAEGDASFDNRLIIAPGADFMTTVYSLQVGETGTVFNQPQTLVFVVRLTSSSPSADALWEQFQLMPPWQYQAAGQTDVFVEAYEAWLDEIRARTGFRWINQPDAMDAY
ncbi:MAG: hypothetical protein FWG73_06205 [Planctomycetaceae bacterium]|nr:hypothetical protein [Planctomycetaceae bacterium]